MFLLMLLLCLLITACRNSDTPVTIDEARQPIAPPPPADNMTIWTPAELALLRSLWIKALPPVPPDPSNAVADDPQAALLGHQLFFDTRLSGNGQFSCATCHQPDSHFTDNLPLAQAMGTTLRSTPTIAGLGHSAWFFWDGRRDSLWSQALTPLEALVEQGGTRTQFAHLLDEDANYRAAYEAIFGALPDFTDRARFPDMAGPFGDEAAQAAWFAMSLDDRELVNQAFANLGKAIAAYERLILPGEARFDTYVEAVLTGDDEQATSILTEDEIAGLQLFLGAGQCIRCHNGPLFTNGGFHNVKVPTGEGLPLDYGRIQGVQQVFENIFNCLGPYSDVEPEQCMELRFAKTSGQELPGAFKVPTLRNVAETAPYMHAGQFQTLAEVLNHYNEAEPGPLGHIEIEPLGLSTKELSQIEAFLHTLSGPLNADPKFLAPPH